MPFVMPTRTGATLFFHLPVEVSPTLRWLASDAGSGASFFHVFCAAVLRTLAERPQLNRYVLDGTLYQRDRITLSFAVKKGYRDDAELAVVKVELSPDDGLVEVCRKVDAAIAVGRGAARTTVEFEIAVLNRLPKTVVRGIVALANALDRRGLLPARMLADDPSHASAMVTNLGSIGLGASFHHLSDHGTSSMVVALGRVGAQPVVADDGTLGVGDVADIKFAIDDRIVDGFYCARSLARFQHHLRHPAALVAPRAPPTHHIPGRLFHQAIRCPEAPAFYTRTGDAWYATSWFSYAEEVRAAGRALVELGVRPGDRVCLQTYNRPEWAVFHLAAMAIGAVPTAIHDDAPPSELAYVLRDAEPTAVLVEGAAAVGVVRATLAAGVPVVLVRKATIAKVDPDVLGWEAFLARGREADDGEVDRRLAAIQPGDTAVMVYTSGTTGNPRGVLLTHDNLAWTASQAAALFDGGGADRTVSYLPLSHIAEQMFTVYVPITTGAAVYFAPTRHGLFDTLREVQPTALFGVPRVWRKLADEVRSVLGEVSAELGERRVARAREAAGRYVAASERGPVPVLVRARYRIARMRVLDRVRERLGLQRVREAFTGAAAIDPDTVAVFAALGIALRETYGQSEGSGPTTFATARRTRAGTVGPAFPGVEVRVDGGEILARGRNVFAGYWRDPAATRAALRDGWLVTGDQGELDADGFLRLTGRTKELLVTEGGEKVAPAALEASLEALPLVDQAVVVGEGRPFLAALLAVDLDAAVAWLTQRGEVPTGALAADPRVFGAVQAQVAAWNDARPRHEHVRAFHLLAAPLSPEDGDLTPTLKVRRSVVARRHAAEIAGLYGESAPLAVPPEAGPVEIGGFVARPVRDSDELQEACGLRYRAFLQAGHIDPGTWPGEVLRDAVDERAIQFVVRDAADELVGTVRLALPEHGLPVRGLFSFDAIEMPAERVGEIGRLAIDPRWRNRRAPLVALVRAILDRGTARGLTHFYAFVPARTVRAYRALGYTTWEVPCGPPTEEMRLRRSPMAPYFATQDPRVIVFTHTSGAPAC